MGTCILNTTNMHYIIHYIIKTMIKVYNKVFLFLSRRHLLPVLVVQLHISDIFCQFWWSSCTYQLEKALFICLNNQVNLTYKFQVISTGRNSLNKFLSLPKIQKSRYFENKSPHTRVGREYGEKFPTNDFKVLREG